MVADYLTLQELKEHLSLTENPEWDIALQAWITGTSRWIDEHCQRHFWQDTTPRIFDSRDGCLLRLGTFNDVVDVTEVATDPDGDGVYDDVWDPGNFQLLPVQPPEGRPYTEIRAIGRNFPVPRPGERVGRIRVIGDPWGWAVVPAQVPRGMLLQAAKLFKRKDAPEGVAGFDQFGQAVRIPTGLDRDTAGLLNNLIHPHGAIPVA